MAASALVERVLANTTGLLTRIQWAPIAIILLSYILKAYVVYVDIRRCHCFPVNLFDALRFITSYTFLLPMNVFVMHSFHHPSTWVPFFLATFCGNFLHVFVEFLPLTDPEAGDMKEAGTIFGAHCPNQVRLRDQDLRALRKVGIRMLRYVHTKDTSKIIDIDLYHNADPLVYSKNMQARDLLTPLPLRGAMKADTFVDSTNTNIAYRFLFRKKT